MLYLWWLFICSDTVWAILRNLSYMCVIIPIIMMMSLSPRVYPILL